MNPIWWIRYTCRYDLCLWFFHLLNSRFALLGKLFQCEIKRDFKTIDLCQSQTYLLFIYTTIRQQLNQEIDQNATNVDEEIQNMPPLPRDVRNKLIKDYNLSLRNVYVLVVIDYLSSPLSTGTSYFLFVIFYPITLLILISLLYNCRMKTKGWHFLMRLWNIQTVLQISLQISLSMTYWGYSMLMT